MAVSRSEVKAAAWEMLRDGIRPSTPVLRKRLGGGSQQTLVDALKEFWGDVGDLLQDAELPPRALEAMRTAWKVAVSEATRRWETEREKLRVEVTEATEGLRLTLDELTGVQGELHTREAELERAHALSQQLQHRVAELDDALEAERTAGGARERQIAELASALEEERSAREDEHASSMRRIDAVTQSLKQEEVISAHARKEIEDLKAQIAEGKLDTVIKQQVISDLEERVRENRSEQERLHRAAGEREQKLYAAAEQIGGLTAHLKELDRQLSASREEAEAQRQLLNDCQDALNGRIKEVTILTTRLEEKEAALKKADADTRSRRVTRSAKKP